MLDRITTQMKAGIGSDVKTLSPGKTQALVASYKADHGGGWVLPGAN